MGYSTDFDGSFSLDKPLTTPHAAYLKAFAESRRMKRSNDTPADPVREAACLPAHPEYFVSGAGFQGQDRDASVLNYNSPPDGQPGLWCQWVPSEDSTAIEWNGGEKFYDYVEWIEYLIEHFLAPWGYTLNGIVTWQGEEHGDIGSLVMVNNSLTVKAGKFVKGSDARKRRR